MWQRFTEQARRVIASGQEEATKMAYGAVGTEHLLLGLLREEQGAGAQILASAGVTYPHIHAEVEIASGVEVGSQIGAASMGKLKLTPKAKRVLELAADEARRMKHNYIGTEHLLLALLREKDGLAANVLRKLGLNLEKARKQVENYPDSSDESWVSPPPNQAYAPPSIECATSTQRLLAIKDRQIEMLQMEVRDLRATLQTTSALFQRPQRFPLLGDSTSGDDFDLSYVKSFMRNIGTALVFAGEGSGERRVADAVQKTTQAPLFKQCIGDAKKLLVNVTAGHSLTTGEIDQIVRTIRRASGLEESQVFWSMTFKSAMEDRVNVTVIATGFAATKGAGAS